MGLDFPGSRRLWDRLDLIRLTSPKFSNPTSWDYAGPVFCPDRYQQLDRFPLHLVPIPDRDWRGCLDWRLIPASIADLTR